jgi:hypothetical protein
VLWVDLAGLGLLATAMSWQHNQLRLRSGSEAHILVTAGPNAEWINQPGCPDQAATCTSKGSNKTSVKERATVTLLHLGYQAVEPAPAKLRTTCF